jgi:hypothetical protein
VFTLAIGFGVGWALVAAYLGWIGIQQRRLTARIDVLQAALDLQRKAAHRAEHARAA